MTQVILLPASIVDAKGDLLAGSADNTVVRVPIGTDGQLLTADSTVASGLSWKAAPSAVAALKTARSGYWYANNLPSLANKALVQNTQYFVPFVVNVAKQIDQLGVKVAVTAAASTIRVGIYADSGNGLPSGAPLAELPTPLDSATSAVAVSGTLTTPLTLAVGEYWLSCVAQGGAPTILGGAISYGVGSSTVNNITSGLNGSYAQTGINAAMAAPGALADNAIAPTIAYHVV